MRAEEGKHWRHWSSGSQRYAPADILLQYLRGGWMVDDAVPVETFYCGGARYVKVYYFRLVYEDEDLWMPVIENPVVLRLIRERNLILRPTLLSWATDGVDRTGQDCQEPGSKSTLTG